MEYSYGKEDLKKWLVSNVDTLLESQTFQALIVEVKVAEDTNNTFVNRAGHDEVGDAGRIETKFTNYIKPAGELRVSKAGENKRNGFDIMRIIDGINERIFEVPHDVWFTRAKIVGNDEFLWSSTYNSKDNIQRGNTELLLEYEVTD